MNSLVLIVLLVVVLLAVLPTWPYSTGFSVNGGDISERRGGVKLERGGARADAPGRTYLPGGA